MNTVIASMVFSAIVFSGVLLADYIRQEGYSQPLAPPPQNNTVQYVQPAFPYYSVPYENPFPNQTEFDSIFQQNQGR